MYVYVQCLHMYSDWLRIKTWDTERTPNTFIVLDCLAKMRTALPADIEMVIYRRHFLAESVCEYVDEYWLSPSLFRSRSQLVSWC